MNIRRNAPGRNGRWQWFILPLSNRAHEVGIARWDLSDRMTVEQAEGWLWNIRAEHALGRLDVTLRPIR